MSYGEYAERDFFAIDAALDDRVAFLRRTYAHLFGAVVLFIGLCAGILLTPLGEALFNVMMNVSWFLVLLAFMGAGYAARSMARSGASEGVQYIGLGLYVVAEAIIFTPLLYAAQTFQGPDIILQAGTITLTIFAGLTAIVMLTRTDFSFLRSALMLGGFAALALIAASLIFGFSLGILFCVGMVVLMCGYILYDTSNVLHHLRTDQHVSAALELFASLATLFWYVLWLMSYLRR